MTKEQIENLQKYLKGLGITRELLPTETLVKHIDQGQYGFTITIELPFELSNFVVRLYFFRDGAGIYSLTRYQGTINYIDHPEKVKSMAFHMTEVSITMRQAFNLLEGRAIEAEVHFKSNNEYRVWLMLNFGETDTRGLYKFRRFRSGSIYNLEKVLELYPISELRDESLRRAIVLSLKAGNAHPVTFLIGGKSEGKLIAANPENRQLTIMPLPDAVKLPVNGTKIVLDPMTDSERNV
jgi:hypothetical protein